MKRQLTWIALLTVCLLLCMIISILPQLLLPDSRLGIASLSEQSAWQLHIGDIDVQANEEALAAQNWLPLSEQMEHMNRTGYQGVYWLQRTLPSADWKEPYLWVQDMTNFELYLNEQPFYSTYPYESKSPIEQPHSLVLFFNLRLIPLSTDFSGQTLYIRGITDGKEPLLGSLKAGNHAAFVEAMLNKDSVKLVLCVLFAAFFMISLTLYWLNRNELAYLYFGIFSLNMVYISRMQSYISHTLFDLSAIYVIKDITVPFSLLSLMGFQEALFEKGKYVMLMKKWRYTLLVFTGICIMAAFLAPSLYEILITQVMMALFLLIIYTGIRGIIYYKQLNFGQRIREANLIIFGFTLMSVFTALHMLIMADSSLSYFIKSLLPSTFWRYDQVLIGCFVFDLCLGMILLYRFAETYKQVKDYASQLEGHNQDLKLLNLLKDDFLAKTSHELRTPIHGIMGITESLLDGSVGQIDDTARRQLTLVAYSGQRLTHLIHDILDHFKLKHQAVVLTLKPVAMKQAVDIVLAILKPQADRKQLSVRNDIAADMPFVAVDEDRIMQVLFNLVANAIKFTQAGHIRVFAEVAENTATLSVEDTGIGISAAALTTIWDPFGQADKTISKAYGGTGLGLTISKQLIHLHGGQISAQSEVGRGSIFSFTVSLWQEALTEQPWSKELHKSGTAILPLLEDMAFIEESSATAMGNKLEEPSLNKPIILIIDDEWLNLEVLSTHLSFSYHVVKTNSAAEALLWMEHSGRPDLILSDLMMPNMTGYDLCARIRQTYHAGELPFLLLSARNETNDIVEGFNVGINDYLSKPIAKRELLARVHLHLELSRLNHSLEDQVKQRTAELEQSYRQLQLSMRETLEAMGEVTMWEERNRIAHEIHDILGHKLTATIVQLEAAKRLMAVSPALALEKLELAQEAVRRGLHDISDAVHTVKNDLKRADLRSSLLELIHETESMSAVTIEFEIGTLPTLHALQKKVLYHALQEGLTNGIKHGQSQQFRFQLREEEGQLCFSLINFGLCYNHNAFGFGLTAMRDKVERLGGAIQLQPLALQGSELQLSFPLSYVYET